MFKPFILVLITLLMLTNQINGQEEQAERTTIDSFDQTTTTTTLATTTTTTTILTTTVLANKTEHKSLSSMVKEKPVANLVQYNGKLLANQTESAINGRIINPSQNSNSVTAVATNGLSLTVVIALIAVVLVVVTAIIASALFVMRRRFSTWRLNGDAGNDSKAMPGSDSTETKEQESKEQCAIEINEKDHELAKQVSLAADAPVSITIENGHANEAVSDSQSEKLEQNEQQQASPSSSSPLIEKSDEVQAIVDTELKEQVTSSSSLIVNVLNELSESVACKLDASAHSPAAKSTHNVVDSAESQPLNKDE